MVTRGREFPDSESAGRNASEPMSSLVDYLAKPTLWSKSAPDTALEHRKVADPTPAPGGGFSFWRGLAAFRRLSLAAPNLAAGQAGSQAGQYLFRLLAQFRGRWLLGKD